MNTTTSALASLSSRLDFFAQCVEEAGLIDAENDPIPARGGAVWPSSHPRWIAFLGLCIAKGVGVRGTATAADLRAELMAVS